MEGETHELWRTLCEQAAVEQHPIRLLELMTRINDLLEQKEKRLTEKRMNIIENEEPISWWLV